MCQIIFFALANNSIARILSCLDAGTDMIRYTKIAIIVCTSDIFLMGCFFILTQDDGKGS